MKSMRILMIPVILIFLATLTGCGSKPVEIVDLDKVLEIMQTTLDELNQGVSATQTGNMDITPDEIAPISAEKENADYNQTFLTRFTANLERAQLTKDPIGVLMLQDGSVEGFRDLNRNNTKDINEASIFKIEIDTERNRLIATDTQQNYRRSRGYSMGGGLFTGYLLGSMLGRQSYSGIRPSRFSNMKMSGNSYRQSASSRTKSKPSARSSSGSRSFKSGK